MAPCQAERQLTELADSIYASSKEEIEGHIKAVREALTTEDVADIDAKRDALNASYHKVSEAMYQRAAEQSAPQEGADSGASSNGTTADEEDVVDAEVVDEGK